MGMFTTALMPKLCAEPITDLLLPPVKHSNDNAGTGVIAGQQDFDRNGYPAWYACS